MIHDMLSIILANTALAVSVKFSNSAYDVTVMYNYTLTLHCKFGWLVASSKFWPDLNSLSWTGRKFGLALKVLPGFKNRLSLKFYHHKIFGLNFIFFLYLFDDFIDFLYCLCLIHTKHPTRWLRCPIVIVSFKIIVTNDLWLILIDFDLVCFKF